MYARGPDGAKILATRGADGICPVCKEPLVAKCGELVVHHWSHKARPDCDMVWVFDAQPYRSRVDIHRYPNRRARFVWRHWRPSHGKCAQPMFWDFGPDTMFRVLDFQPGTPTVGHGVFINPGAFMAWYGVTPFPERKPREGNG